jgi:hypothetical protein
MNVWTTSNINIKHGITKINYRSHNNSKFSWIFSQWKCIFIIKPLYSSMTHFNMFNMEIHLVFIFFNNLKCIKKKISKFCKVHTLQKVVSKKNKKSYHMDSMWNTKVIWITKWLFSSRIHLQSILVHTNLGWQCQANARQWFMGLELCWIYIWSGWHYRWMFETRLIQFFEQPFFRSCDFLLAFWISFSHLFIGFMHAHLHYVFQRLLGRGISLSFHLSLVHNRGILWEECCLW